MAFYPTPGVNNTADLETVATFSNDVSGGIFLPFTLFAIWIIAFIGSKAEGRETYRAWIFANFMCSVIAIPMGLLGWLQPVFIYLFIILLAIGIIWAKMSSPVKT